MFFYLLGTLFSVDTKFQWKVADCLQYPSLLMFLIKILKDCILECNINQLKEHE